MPKYEKNSGDYRLVSKILSKLTDEFGSKASQDEVIAFVASNFNVRRPEGIINDLVDNGFGKVDEENVYFINEKGGEKEELSEEMKIILEIISSEGTSRKEALEVLKEKGFGRKARSLLGEARKKELIKGVVINKTPTYVRI